MSAEQESLDKAEQEILESIGSGLASVSTDGLTSTFVDPMKRLEALQKLRTTQAQKEQATSGVGFYGLGFCKLIPPGGG